MKTIVAAAAVVFTAVACLVVGGPVAALRRWRLRAGCLHHNPHTGPGEPPETYLTWHFIDGGMRRMHKCTRCGKTFIT